MTRMVYLDNAATTPCRKEVVDAMTVAMTRLYGNPSSKHRLGQEARNLLRHCRAFFAEKLGVEKEQVLFTGSGSEANNLVISGLAAEALRKNKGAFGHFVCSQVEHSSVYQPLLRLKQQGALLDVVLPENDGALSCQALMEVVTPETQLVSIMQVNNETGVIHDVAALAKSVKQRFPQVKIHVDGVQGLGKIPVPSLRHIDFFSASAHKLYGPKGCGLLISKGSLYPLMLGGGQEAGVRPGTENLPGISGFQTALALALEEQEMLLAHYQSLNRLFWDMLLARLGDKFVFNVSAKTVPYIVNLSFPGFEAEVLVRMMSDRGICISSGSACQSNQKSSNRVLEAYGLPTAQVKGTLRFSFGRETSVEDLDLALFALEASYRELRQIKEGRL